jgi:hypothetical protein
VKSSGFLSSSPLYSWQYHVAPEIGLFLQRGLRGKHGGDSGRNKLQGLQNKIYVIVRNAESKVYNHPALVVRSVTALCYCSGSWGDCIFVHLPTQREASIAVAEAGFDWPATIR